MTKAQIAKLCNSMAFFEVESSFEEQTPQCTKAQQLEECCDAVLEMLYCHFGTALAKCTAKSVDGVIDLSGMDFCRVVRLTDMRGQAVAFRYTAQGIAVPDGLYNLTYATLPPKTGWQQEVVFPSPRITDRIFAYGVAAEYFFRLGDTESYQLWKTRFDNALRSARRKVMGSLPVGRWL